MNTTVLTIAAFCGLTFLIKDSAIFYTPRIWCANRSAFMRELLQCSFCVGFHSGYLVYLLLLPKLGAWSWRIMLLYALASAACSYVFDLITGKIDT